MYKRKLHVYKLGYVGDILNQARNVYRTSLINTHTQKQKENKQPTTTTNENRKQRKGKEQHIVSSDNSSDNKDQNISGQLLLLLLPTHNWTVCPKHPASHY